MKYSIMDCDKIACNNLALLYVSVWFEFILKFGSSSQRTRTARCCFGLAWQGRADEVEAEIVPCLAIVFDSKQKQFWFWIKEKDKYIFSFSEYQPDQIIIAPADKPRKRWRQIQRQNFKVSDKKKKAFFRGSTGEADKVMPFSFFNFLSFYFVPLLLLL